MVVGGKLFNGSYITDAEVIDLSAGGTTCEKPDDYPARNGHMVATYHNGAPLVCGGFDGSFFVDDCYAYLLGGEDEGWARTQFDLRDQRGFAAGSRMPDTGDFFVSGGSGTASSDSTTEVLDAGSSNFRGGPGLPEGFSSHCMVAINATAVFIAGGLDRTPTVKAIAFIFHTDDGTVVFVDNLSTARASHSCGIVDGRKVVVTGGVDAGQLYLDSTEIFDLVDMSWSAGAPLPQPIHSAAAVPYGNTFLLVGGNTGDAADLETILEYDDANGAWPPKDAKLGTARNAHVVISLPNDFGLGCQ